MGRSTTSNCGTCTAAIRAVATIPFGISGVYVLRLPASRVTPGKPLNLAVRVPAAGGGDWFMVHEYRDVAAVTSDASVPGRDAAGHCRVHATCRREVRSDDCRVCGGIATVAGASYAAIFCSPHVTQPPFPARQARSAGFLGARMPLPACGVTREVLCQGRCRTRRDAADTCRILVPVSQCSRTCGPRRCWTRSGPTGKSSRRLWPR